MPTILTKKKDTTGAPAPGDLTNSAGGAELAVNTFDKRLYTKDAGGNVVEIGTNPSTIDTTTVDTTNLEVTNIKAKDGTASATIANSTGIFTHSTATVFPAGTVSAPAITTTGDTNTGIYFPAADTIAFSEGGVESMRIDSAGNLGIGTSSPSGRLSVNLGTATSNGAPASWDSTYAVFGGAGSVSGSAVALGVGSQGGILSSLAPSSAWLQMNYLANFHVFYRVNSVEAMRIDSAGNLGIGTSSPTNYGAGTTSLSISNATGSGYFDLYNAGLRRGYHYATASTYNISTTSATALVLETVGSERMRITSSGDVGIGTSGPNYKLSVNGTGNFYSGVAGLGRVFFGDPGDPSGYVGLYRSTLGPSNSTTAGNGLNFASIDGYTFNTGAGTPFGSQTERMRIDSSGNVGIGTSSPNAYTGYTTLTLNNASTGSILDLNVNGTRTGSLFANSTVVNLQSRTAIPLVFETNASERMRIDSSGNLLVGRAAQLTGTGMTLSTDGRSVSCTLAIQAHNGSGFDPRIVLEAPGSNSGYFWYSRNNGQIRASVGGETTGVSLAGGATSWGSFSDERMKDIIEPITNAAEKVSSLRAVIGKYKTDEENKRRVFLIAQDVEAVLPEAVYKNSGDNNMLSLAYTDVIPLLVASIKELKTELDSVKAELQTLKGV